MPEQRVALITGANKGIGLAIARSLAAHGLTVLVGARDLALGEAAAKSIGGSARAIALDVTSLPSIAAAAAEIRRAVGRLDVLINNAGIARAGGPPSTAVLAEARQVFETNVLGVIAVTQAMLPLLREAPAARIVNISSSLGSLTSINVPGSPYPGVAGVAYGPSKSALNAITVAVAHELAATKLKVNAACPGYTATDMTGHHGPRTVEQAAREPVRLALLADDGPTGGFTNEDGPIPW